MLNYLATPYTHDDRRVRRKRAQKAAMLACRLIQQGLYIFCPIAHTHAIAECGDLPCGFEYWGEFDRIMLNASQRLLIGKIEGWEDSKGIAAEIQIMRALGRPIVLVDPETLVFTPDY